MPQPSPSRPDSNPNVLVFSGVTESHLTAFENSISTHDTISGSGAPSDPYYIHDPNLTVSAIYDPAAGTLTVTIERKSWFLPISTIRSQIAAHLGVS
jgi:hypothetical protein